MVALLRALSASGDTYYTASIRKISDETKSVASENRAKHSLSKISWYAIRNKLMQDMNNHKEGQSYISTRYINLLNHPKLNIKRYAAEELYRLGSAEDAVVDKLWSGLDTKLGGGKPSPLKTDTLAWYCRAIVKLAKENYRDRIQDIIADRSINAKIRKHCKKELSR